MNLPDLAEQHRLWTDILHRLTRQPESWKHVTAAPWQIRMRDAVGYNFAWN